MSRVFFESLAFSAFSIFLLSSSSAFCVVSDDSWQNFPRGASNLEDPVCDLEEDEDQMIMNGYEVLFDDDEEDV